MGIKPLDFMDSRSPNAGGGSWEHRRFYTFGPGSERETGPEDGLGDGRGVLQQGNRILIFESFLIYQHFHPEPLTLHPEPVEGLHPLLLILSPLPLILSLSKDCTPYSIILSPLPLILSLSKDGLSTTFVG